MGTTRACVGLIFNLSSWKPWPVTVDSFDFSFLFFGGGWEGMLTCGIAIRPHTNQQIRPLVEVLSLSINNINTLACFAGCSKLRELYLRRNGVATLEELGWLAGLDDLRVCCGVLACVLLWRVYAVWVVFRFLCALVLCVSGLALFSFLLFVAPALSVDPLQDGGLLYLLSCVCSLSLAH